MATDTPNKPHNLSRHQYGTLRFIHKRTPTMDDLRHISNVTLASLAYQKWIQRRGAHVVLTPLGVETLNNYTAAVANERAHVADLTERCLRLLQYSRRLAVVGPTPAGKETTHTATG